MMTKRITVQDGDKNLPHSPQNRPYPVEVDQGRVYRWCSCGLSQSQPWCDDSHEGTSYEPITFEAPVNGIFYMCGCKKSDNKPYCFGNCMGHSSRQWSPDTW